ncbi:hypothetical protein QJS04_geneDACA008001 [Acorus gramineus]|uniref:Chlororespiratory reduction 7 n=1 Tax=Acorus gramineus TaxID=55184 RepID=A0AAV9BAM6_ACOGR|nr:hypothetical protein QJS04_geneDACA008001 [Acorus gramineus]
MEGALKGQLFCNGFQSFNGKQSSSIYLQSSLLRLNTVPILVHKFSWVYLKPPQNLSHEKRCTETHAIRRRRAYMQTDTFVLMEPGKGEEFVSKEELKDRLKGWLQNWPGNVLPPDLARFKTIDDAVSHLVKSVCELEIDGDVGSIQWYEVRLE